MCGITGFVDKFNRIENKEQTLLSMMNSINHRGPDSNGFWISNDKTISIGHLRLSIIDTTEGGHQPMHSVSGRYVISFNGELYNFIYLKKKLELLGAKFKSSSDTEVILTAFEYWGIDSALDKFQGMFAIALFDKKINILYLLRDRMGEKPLFFGLQNNLLFFSSEIRSFNSIECFSKEVSYDSINDFIHYGYFLDNKTIYKNVKNLSAGTYLKIEVSKISDSIDQFTKTVRYWDPKKPHTKNQYSNIDLATDELEILLKDTIRDQMISDVPLGAFLSGGIDSSLIVSLMSEISSRKVKTFSIGFDNDFYDESKYASSISNYLGTDHNELVIKEKDIIDFAASMSNGYDQPFGDVSSIPTRLVSNFAKSQVTVSLSGDAGDELFCGYDRYSVFDKFYNLPFRNIIGKSIKLLPNNLIGNIFSKSKIHNIKYINSHRISKLGDMLSADKHSRFNYQSLFMSTTNIDKLNIFKFDKNMILGRNYYKLLKNEKVLHFGDNHLETAMLDDLVSYLPNDILVKVDRAAMSVSLETRIPFLNHKVVEFALKLPLKYKYNKREGKKLILKNLLSRKMPEHLFERPKKGFGAPVEDWLKGPLADWMMDSLSSEQLNKTNVFQARGINGMISDFQTKKNQQGQFIWNILMLQNWMIANKVVG